MTRTFEFRNPRPRLLVENLGGSSLGRCYSASFQRVTSTLRMTREQLEALRMAGVIHSGQELYIRSQCDGKEAAAGEDTVPCVAVVDGAVVDEPAINPYSGKLYAPIQCSYFVYDIETRCDSGD